ncbi:hypothetical protein [Pedobacter insulae]|uniref:SUKH-4 immunity protein n=1 Tax=Pedobacter insulae TaxID=414048 RepID=A0A1I2VWP2_9SPHI|nr:hypothetical protein [Pedobacter insulae]SFG91751.1 hypothetical protein SAMN04489864_103211 [Pedobacter insulae]
MNSQEFINEIAKLKPSAEELSPTHSDELVNLLLNSFVIQHNSLQGSSDNPIIDLIKANDISLLNINDITFDPDLYEDEEFIFFGWDINDRLGILKSNGKIVAYDGFSGRIMFWCADNSSKFLDALVEIMKFFREMIVKDYEEDERDKRAVDVAYIAALKAGGEQYEDYYKSVLGID